MPYAAARTRFSFRQISSIKKNTPRTSTAHIRITTNCAPVDVSLAFRRVPVFICSCVHGYQHHFNGVSGP